MAEEYNAVYLSCSYRFPLLEGAERAQDPHILEVLVDIKLLLLNGPHGAI